MVRRAGHHKTHARRTRTTAPARRVPPTPRCFLSRDQWIEYYKLKVYESPKDHTYCSDCTPEYRDGMVSVGRCAWPGTRFRIVDGMMIGVRG